MATTCNRPLFLSIMISLPKAIDRMIATSECKVYISAVQAPFTKAIDSGMLQHGAIEKKRH